MHEINMKSTKTTKSCVNYYTLLYYHAKVITAVYYIIKQT